MKKRQYLYLLALTLGIIFSLGDIALLFAQETNSQEFTLEEITVTAEKRTEDVQKTPVSVTTLDGDALLLQGRITIQDILKDVPGVRVDAMESNGAISVVATDNPASAVKIRGVPSAGGNIGITGQLPTAYYADGVYGGIGGDFDVSRVEVLRGPQGTLYGRSATSGLVAVHTQSPVLGKFEGTVTGEFGSYNLTHIEGALNVPMGESLALRLSANHYGIDGLLSRKGTQQKKQTVRAKLLYEPNETFSALLGYIWRDDDDNSGGAGMFTLPNQPNAFIVEYGYPYSIIHNNKTKHRQLWGQFDWKTGIGTLTYQPAYRTYETAGKVSAIGGVVEQYTLLPEDKFMTHELRLTSSEDAPFKWVIGGFYYQNELKNEVTPRWAVSQAMIFSQEVDRRVDDKSAFAELTYPFNDTLRVTAGLRYDITEVQVNQTNSLNITPTTPDSVPGAFLEPDRALPETLISMSLGGKDGYQEFKNTTYKLRLEKDLTPDNMMYAMISTAFLPGDVTIANTGPALVKMINDQEELTSYEIGSKNRFMKDRLQLNGSVFYYDYEGYQVQANINPERMNSWALLTSAAEMYGIEIEANYLVTANDRIDLSYGHTTARFTDKPDTPENPFTTFVGQTDIPGVAPDTAALGYTHTFMLSNGSVLEFYNQLRYTAGYDRLTLTSAQIEEGAVPYIHEGDMWLDDASLGWTSPEGTYGVTFYVHNVLDKQYKEMIRLAAPTPPWLGQVVPNMPRTYGIVLQAKF